MTLVCQKCGGPVIIQEAQERNKDNFVEIYECPNGHVGTSEVRNGRQRLYGLKNKW